MRVIFTYVMCVASSLAFGQSIQGVVFDGVKDEPVSFASVYLLRIDDEYVLERALTDENGSFKLSNEQVGIFHLKVSYIPCGDTIYHNLKIEKDTALKLDFHKACQYDHSVKDKTCPICKRTDQVIPIVYGELVTVSNKVETIKNSPPRSSESYVDFYPGGCVITCCDPNWYCKRNDLEF